MQDISEDKNIRNIAQYLLQQEYSTMREDSRVIQIERDFPYYRFVFLSGERSYITIIVLYDLVSNKVQVMSVTSKQIANQEQETQPGLTAAQKVTTTTQTSSSGSVNQQGQTNSQTSQPSGLVNQNNLNSVPVKQTITTTSTTSSEKTQSQSNINLVPAKQTITTT